MNWHNDKNKGYHGPGKKRISPFPMDIKYPYKYQINILSEGGKKFKIFEPEFSYSKTLICHKLKEIYYLQQYTIVKEDKFMKKSTENDKRISQIIEEMKDTSLRESERYELAREEHCLQCYKNDLLRKKDRRETEIAQKIASLRNDIEKLKNQKI